jgi:uncharacterized protein DUF5681
MSKKLNTSNDYVVGYRKPPLHTRFKKGESGNVRGRPKGARNLAGVLERELNAPVTINENGQRKTITKFEAVIKLLVNQTLKPDLRALQQLLALHRFVYRDEADSQAEPLCSENDEQVISGILKRMQRNDEGDGGDGTESL